MFSRLRFARPEVSGSNPLRLPKRRFAIRTSIVALRRLPAGDSEPESVLPYFFSSITTSTAIMSRAKPPMPISKSFVDGPLEGAFGCGAWPPPMDIWG